MKINGNYRNLKESYLFTEIGRKVEAFKNLNPDKKVIRLGIGDVTLPLPKTVVKAMEKASAEMGEKNTFRGYGPEQGYTFLKEAIANYYLKRNVKLDKEEIFVSDGAKSDVANILDIFCLENIVLIPNPVYPVYLDTNIMHGRDIIYCSSNQENNFLPMPDENVKADIIYLCSPNNPTGAVYNKNQLEKWVEYAIKNDAVILFDAAYEAFIMDENLPRSIYEIDGAEKCAIELCSLSKTAGFTGTRCGYTIVPKALEREGVKLNKLWLRRQCTKFNGVSYVIQRAAEAVFSEEGQKEVKENIAYYMRNAAEISKTFTEMGISHTGGKNSPYIWFKVFGADSSWEFFDKLLNVAAVVGTPGSGFGECGEGYFRMTAFGDLESTLEAMNKIKLLMI